MSKPFKENKEEKKDLINLINKIPPWYFKLIFFLILIAIALTAFSFTLTSCMKV